MEINEKMLEAEFNSLLAAAHFLETDFITSPFRKEYLEFALAHIKAQAEEIERLRRTRADIDEILNASIRVEEMRKQASEDYVTRGVHQYAKGVCKMLQADISLIERKYTE